VFFVEVTNPTDQPVNADIRLTTYEGSGENYFGPIIDHTRQVEVAAHQTSIVEFRFNFLEARFIAGQYSASVIKTEPIEKVATAPRWSGIRNYYQVNPNSRILLESTTTNQIVEQRTVMTVRD